MKFIKNLLRYGIFFIIILGIWFFFGNKIRELQGFTIAVIAGTPYEIKAHQFKNVSEIQLCDDNQQIFRQLSNRQVDGILTERLAGLSQIQKNGYQKIKPVGELMDRETTAIGFLPGDKALIMAINRAFLAVIHNGTYGRISRKYFGRNILPSVKADSMVTDRMEGVDDSWLKVRQRGQITLAMIIEENHQFDLEIAAAICHRLGIQLITVMIPWDEISEGLRYKRYDGIWGASDRIEEYLNHEVEFSVPVYYSGSQLFVHEGSRIRDLEILQQEKPFRAFSLSKLFPKMPHVFEN